MSDTSRLDPNAAWASLKHGGLLLAPNRLADVFPDSLQELAWKTTERLRRAIIELDGDSRVPASLMDTVLEEVLGLGRPLEPETGKWLKGSSLGTEWTHRALSGEAIKPQRVWQGEYGAELPVFVDTELRIGIGRGRRMPARVAEWLRAMGRHLALLTNGKQWRLIHAALDSDAYAEWDTSLWFDEGEPGPQVTALRALLDRERLSPPKEEEPAPLVAAIAASRKGQGELSAFLGERVRQAVELLIRRVFRDEELPLGLEPNEATRKEIYRSATRVGMRMVVILFAEARDDLLPRSNPIYHLSYGLQGLREALQQSGAGTKDGLARLAHRHAAWPRVLSLFRLIYHGSPHKDLTLPRYGGGLFEAGDPDSTDTLRRALAVLEDPARGPTDADVYRMLDFLCVTEMRVRQGKASKRVHMPVDFSDLSSEYIGILYEGLLDYELRRADPGDPIIFLNLGDQPALPLSRLEAMDDKALAGLVEKLKVKGSKASDSEDDTAEEEEETEDGDSGEEADADEAEDEVAQETADEENSDDSRRSAEERARSWAQRAVEAGKLVKKPKSKKKDALEKFQADVESAARALIARTVLPGEWFLVRWGGTRKGAGTFYTRPALAVPTVHRTLRALVYDPPEKNGKPDEDAPAAEWTPKKPEEILALKVCDPAMGSASFLVASLRFLTEGLFASLHHHGRISEQGEKTLVTLAEGKPSQAKLDEETLPCRPDADDFEIRLKAILKRYVVERCVYGVDIDPLAVELGRLALWVETLDRNLPFEFLDHKLKVGNSLVGCWFDRFRDYPVLAWEREGGDKSHSNGVHYEQEGWTKAIKAARNGVVKRELVELISRQATIEDHIQGRTPEQLHDQAFHDLEAINRMPVFDAEARATYYREHLRDNEALRQLRAAFDAWCAVWFWPADRLDDALTPRTFGQSSGAQLEIVRDLFRMHRFFHWELEFPDVFCDERRSEPDTDASTPVHSGFDAIVGNPPWEIQKPNSKEFFSNLDPLYRTYGKQAAIQKQKEMFEASEPDERSWLEYNARFKGLSNWNKSAASPFGDGACDGVTFSFRSNSAGLHAQWVSMRGGHRGYADPRHPYLHQGSADINTYKMFLEQAHSLLRSGGQMGMIVPSGLYTDKGSTALRELFLEKCRWQLLFGMINWNKIFASIYYRFKFCFAIVRKGGTTHAVQAAFSRYHLEEWLEVERYLTPYTSSQATRFSPRTRALLEVREKRDLEVVEKIYASSVLLGDDSEDGWGIKYATEFHMTNDSKLFPPRPWWEERGYVPDEYGRWIKFKGSPNPKKAEPEVGWIRLRDGGGSVAESDIEDVALPLYEGRMIDQFDFSAKGWLSGKGRRARWPDIPWESKVVTPQYLMSPGNYSEAEDRDGKPKAFRGTKVAFMDVTSATNERTMIASAVPDRPCGNSAPVLSSSASPPVLSAVLNSIAYDYATRARCGGLHLNYFVVDETPLIRVRSYPLRGVTMASRLNIPSTLFAGEWLRLCDARLNYQDPSSVPWKAHWALTAHERLRLRCILDATLCELYGLDFNDLVWMLRDCDHPTHRLNDKAFYRTLDPKGFWRVEKGKDPELRHTVLTLVAFRDLRTTVDSFGDRGKGIEAFLGQDSSEGWTLPETLCLGDYGLGHDDRAKKPQPVRERLGERFLPWQLEQSVEESWQECEIHARNILGEEGFARLQRELRGEIDGDDAESQRVAEPAPTYGTGAQRRLFPGQQTLFGDEIEDPPRPRRRKRS